MLLLMNNLQCIDLCSQLFLNAWLLFRFFTYNSLQSGFEFALSLL